MVARSFCACVQRTAGEEARAGAAYPSLPPTAGVAAPPPWIRPVRARGCHRVPGVPLGSPDWVIRAPRKEPGGRRPLLTGSGAPREPCVQRDPRGGSPGGTGRRAPGGALWDQIRGAGRGAGSASPASRCPAPPRPARPRRLQASVAPQAVSPATLAKTFGSRRVGSGPAPSRVRSASEPGTESSTFLRQEAAVAKRKATPETLSAERSDKTLPTGPNNSFKYIPNLNRFLLAC